METITHRLFLRMIHIISSMFQHPMQHRCTIYVLAFWVWVYRGRVKFYGILETTIAISCEKPYLNHRRTENIHRQDWWLCLLVHCFDDGNWMRRSLANKLLHSLFAKRGGKYLGVILKRIPRGGIKTWEVYFEPH